MNVLSDPQGSPAWYAARKGIPTCSKFRRIVTPAKWQPASGAIGYIYELLGEILGESVSDYAGSPDIERGHRMEPEARRWLAMEIGEDIREVGFVDCGRYGGSPDGLTASGIPIEIKAPSLQTYFAWLDEFQETGEIPREHLPQVHGHMICTGADHCWFCFYPESGSVRPIAARIDRDEKTEALEKHLSAFCDLLDRKRNQLIEDVGYHI